MIPRRLALLTPLVASLAASPPSLAAPARPPLPSGPRRLALRHAATGARFAGTWHNGEAPDPVALAELSAVLGDHRSGTSHPYDPAVLEMLWEMGQRLGWREEFVVVSGFRTPASNARVCGAGNSQHLRAGALDVAAPARRFAAMQDAALRLGRGGIGSYPRSGFLHVDSGPLRRWSEAAETRPAAPDPLSRMAAAWAAVSGR